jgi:hypothetical protein
MCYSGFTLGAFEKLYFETSPCHGNDGGSGNTTFCPEDIAKNPVCLWEVGERCCSPTSEKVLSVGKHKHE